ncbi:MAG: InlB B-repeat-containing protein [Lachnospiraceae bacterium]
MKKRIISVLLVIMLLSIQLAGNKTYANDMQMENLQISESSEVVSESITELIAEDTSAASSETSSGEETTDIVTETPVTEIPETESPVTEAPATETPVTEIPVTETPVTEAPVTETPVTETPATEESTETPDEASTEIIFEDSTETSTETDTEEFTIEMIPEAFALMSLTDPIQVPDASNYIMLDPNNSVLKTPADFGIGKKGEFEFALTFLITVNDIPEAQRSGVAAVFTIPAGFSVQNMPQVSDVTFTKTTNADGSTTVKAICGATVTASVVGQFTIRQNATTLLNSLSATQGTYNFDMQIYTGYGTVNQVAVTTPTSQTGYTARLLLQADASTPTFTITNLTDTTTFMPGELPTNLGRAYTSYYLASASIDALAGMYTNATGAGKGFTIQIHKSEGYLTNDAVINMVLPRGTTDLFTDRNVWYTTYTTDSGVEVGRGNLNNGNVVNILNAGVGTVSFAAATKSAQTSSTTEYDSPRDVTGLSYADIYYQAGTLTLTYYPNVYYNRLYNGDWSDTVYSADSGCTVTYKDFSTGANVTVTGDPLDFNFINGTDTIIVANRDLYIKSSGATFSTIAQYGNGSSTYNDSVVLSAISNFNDNSKSFPIQDNLKVSYDYEETLTPTWLGNLGTSKEFGLTYRIYVTDAVTGQISRIETLVDEESWAAGYTPQQIDGITETAVNGAALSEWNLAEANNAGNTKYVSRIEVLRTQFEFNKRGAAATANTTYCWFDYTLRAYHARLSNGSDIGTSHKAKIHRETSSDQILAQNNSAIKADFTVTTMHLIDNIRLWGSSDTNSEMEVNDHMETGLYGRYRIVKYADTMKYNVDADGNTVAFGNAAYNPVVTELYGDAITLTDRIERSNQRLLGIWDENGQYHDLSAEGVDPENYLVDAKSSYLDGYETTDMTSTHDYSTYSGQLYKLDEIYTELGISYATRLVVAMDTINDWTTPNAENHTYMSIFINKVMPGYLNYDNLIGTNGSADLPKQFSLNASLYCEYSDYVSEKVNGNSAIDSNGGTTHGSKASFKYNTAKLIAGSYAGSISILDKDYYVDPYSALTSDNRGVSLTNGIVSTGVYQQENAVFMELTRVNVAIPTTLQMQYKQAEIDFSGTDEKLLSLTNSVSFPYQAWWTIWDFSLEYTLSTGESKTVDDSVVQFGPNNQGRTYYTIPDVDIENGIYLTSLKIKFGDDHNWGTNGGKIYSSTAVTYQKNLPTVGLAMNNVNIPSVYPGTDITIGSVSDNETDDTYDKLNVEAKLSFTNIFGEELTSDASKYVAAGQSVRIAGQILYVDFLSESLSYSATSVNQGKEVTITASTQWRTEADAVRMMINNDIKLRPTYYFKVDKNFNYVDGSLSNVSTGATALFLPAGVGEGKSGNVDYGILKISYDEVEFNNLAYASYSGSTYAYRNDIPKFKLQARFDAAPVSTVAVSGVWMDMEYDANRDGSGGNEAEITVETTNSKGLLLDTAPYGDTFGNTETAKDTNNNGYAEMLYVAISNTIKVNEQAVLGVLPYAIATSPFQESTASVTSRDLTEVENLFSERIFMSGDTTTDTFDWVVYVPIMKKGESYKYIYGGNTLYSAANDFSVDFMSIDTTDLDTTTSNYRIFYTTDSNPASGAMQGAQSAGWTEFQNNTGEAVAGLPTDMSTVTMIKITVDQIIAKDKIYVDLDYKLNEHKSVIGDQKSQTTIYANFKMGQVDEYYFGTNGQSGVPLTYNLKDMTLSGYVWDESDYNSVYNADNIAQNSKYAGAILELYSQNGTKVDQTGNSKFTSNSTGAYTLIMPNDGPWNVKINLPSGKKLVAKQVSGDASVDSAFDRSTMLAAVDFVPNVAAAVYTLTNVNAGIYNKPVISVSDVIYKVGTDNKDVLDITVQYRVPSSAPANIELREGELVNVASIEDNGNETANILALSTGIVTGVVTVVDGYGEFESSEFDITIYANVLYNGNTATGGVPLDETKYYPSLDSTGNDAMTDKVTVMNQASLVKTGYHFLGWASEAAALTAEYTAGEVFQTKSLTQDITLYAVWEKNTYEIAYDSNSGSGNMDSQTCYYDVSTNLNKNQFTRTGYQFTGWNTVADGSGTVFTDEQEIINLLETGSITLYAQWNANAYTVHFDANSGSGTMDPQEFEYDVSESLNENTFVKSGYTFSGWSYSQDGAIYFLDKDEVLNLTDQEGGSITLYAVWAVNGDTKYSVEYYLQNTDGTYSFTPSSIETFTGMTDSQVSAFAKKFAGYSFDSVSLKNIVSGIISGDGSLILKLYYRSELSVAFDTNGGSANPASQTVLYGDQATEPDDPYRDGYIFKGWYYTNDVGEEILWNYDDAVTKNMLLTAKWAHAEIVLDLDQDPPIQKKVSNGEKDSELSNRTFTFTMTASTSDTPMPTGSLSGTKTVNINGEGSVEFGTILYSESNVGHTYSYQLTEVDTGISGYTYDDSSYTMQITISYNSDNTALEKSIVFFDENGSELSDATQVTFTNTYTKKTTTTTTTTTTNTNTTIVNVIYSKVIMPLTGDDSNSKVLLLIMCISTATILFIIIRRKRKKIH